MFLFSGSETSPPPPLNNSYQKLIRSDAWLTIQQIHLYRVVLWNQVRHSDHSYSSHKYVSRQNLQHNTANCNIPRVCWTCRLLILSLAGRFEPSKHLHNKNHSCTQTTVDQPWQLQTWNMIHCELDQVDINLTSCKRAMGICPANLHYTFVSIATTIKTCPLLLHVISTR